MKSLTIDQTKAVSAAGIIGKIITHVIINQAIKHGMKKINQHKQASNQATLTVHAQHLAEIENAFQ